MEVARTLTALCLKSHRYRNFNITDVVTVCQIKCTYSTTASAAAVLGGNHRQPVLPPNG